MTQDQATKPPRRSWWNRTMPVRVRQNIRLIMGSIVALALTGVLLGSVQIRPIVFSAGEMLPTITHNIAGGIDLFDLSQPHSIEIMINEINYARMISDFKRFEEKTFVEASAIIDGTLIPSVAIRLKGNSTLMQISGRIPRIPANDPPPGEATESSGPPGVPLADGEDPGTDPDAEPVPPLDPVRMRMFRFMGGATEEDPVTLPLLLSFDEFFPGRGYQGRTELSLRPVAGGGASLNEALTLQLIADSQQITQKYTWVSFSVNGEDTTSRLVLENPNQNYAAALGLKLGRGVLYKSRNGNKFVYRGQDPILYAEEIQQLSAIGMRDISPVIRFIEWLDSASFEEFDSDLGNWLDIPSFARYVVTQDLMDNFDDMAGPGRNFLLWWDLDVEKFTVITWDMNLAMVGVGSMFSEQIAAARDSVLAARESIRLPHDENNVATETATEPLLAEVAEPDLPTADPATDEAVVSEEEEDEEALPSRITFGNILKDKFTTSPVYGPEIARAREELYELWFGSGHTVELIKQLTQLVPVTDRLSAQQIASQTAELIEFVNAREL